MQKEIYESLVFRYITPRINCAVYKTKIKKSQNLSNFKKSDVGSDFKNHN